MTGDVTRRWSELRAGETKALFETYVAGHSDRVAALLREVGERGGPIERLDFTRDSLGPLWAWVMENEPPPAGPVSDESMRGGEPPWWYPFHPQLGQRIGPRLARLVTLVAAYLAETILRHRPGSTWVIGTDPNGADHNQPLLHVAGRGEFLPDSVLLVMANQWANRVIASPDRLLDVFDTRAGPDRPERAARDLPVEAFTLERDVAERFDTVISFDEVIAHEANDRIDQFVFSLAKATGVLAAVREDREIILVRAPRLTDLSVAALVDEAWRASGT
jgi:hypothetical protein